MPAHLFTAAGEKKGPIDLPSALFAAPVNWGLMHQAVVRQQSNRRLNIAHVKTRGEVAGSTKKLFAQKHTGRARRGPVRSPVMRGGGKTFGPRNDRNFTKDMPQKMRHAALRSCLTVQAQKDAVSVLEGYPEQVKTKTVVALLKKMSLDQSRRVLFVIPEKMKGLELSARNIPGLKTVLVSYLNAEDILNARQLVFLQDSLAKAEQLFGKQAPRVVKEKEKKAPAKPKVIAKKTLRQDSGQATKTKKATKTTTKSAKSKKDSSVS